jgi:hypothetical protein
MAKGNAEFHRPSGRRLWGCTAIYKSERFGWLVDNARLTPRQRFGYLIGISVGIGIASFISDRYLHGAFARFAIFLAGSLVGGAMGLFLSGFNPIAPNGRCAIVSDRHQDDAK